MKNPRETWGFKLGVSSMLTWGAAIVLLINALAFTAISIYHINVEKSRDTAAIVYLSLERSAYQFLQRLETYPQADTGLAGDSGRLSKFPDFILRQEKPGSWQWSHGVMPVLSTEDNQALDELLLDSQRGDLRFAVWRFAGHNYLVRILQQADPRPPELKNLEGMTLALLWDFSNSHTAALAQNASQDSLLYLLNRSGQLIWSSHPSIDQQNVRQRPLMAKFKQLDSDRLQVELKDGKNSVYGAFHEVPQSNLILFAESPREYVNQVVRKSFFYLMFAGLFILVFALILLQWPLRLFEKPLRDVTKKLSTVAQGNFSLVDGKPLVAELQELTVAANTIIRKLYYCESDRHQLKLKGKDGEAAAAKSETLPHLLKPVFAPTFTARLSQNLSNRAWQAYCWDYTQNRFILVQGSFQEIAGSSMNLSSLLATIFHLEGAEGTIFDRSSFLRKVQDTLNYFCGEGWELKMSLAEYFWESRTLTLSRAGHEGLYLVNQGEQDASLDRLQLASQSLKSQSNASWLSENLELSPGTTLMMADPALEESVLSTIAQHVATGHAEAEESSSLEMSDSHSYWAVLHVK